MNRSADRMRVLRARRQRGRIPLVVEVDEVLLCERLIAAGFLGTNQQDDRTAVSDAVSRLLDALARAPE